MKRNLFPPRPRGVKKWSIDISEALYFRKKGVVVDGIEYIKSTTNESVYAEYELFPVAKVKGLYRIEENMMSEKSYRRKKVAEEIETEIEKQRYLSEKPVNKTNTRRMYATIDYSVIKQLRDEMGIKTPGEATQQFKLLVERQRIKKRIHESGDRIARAIYEEGRKKEPTTGQLEDNNTDEIVYKGKQDIREIGYIGGLTGRKGHIERVYNLNDPRAKKINESVFESLLEGDKRLRDHYEERQL